MSKKLFARNLDVDIFNYERLQFINNPLKTFIAEDEGNPFYLKKMLAPKKPEIKIAAPVMLLTNITDQLVNGATGTVMKIEDEIITVDFQIHGACNLVNLQRFKFTKFDPLKKIVIASRYQFPIKLCFGVTIHKSQGMSIPNLEIDCKVACHSGQIGVAVGRAITTDGLRVLNFSPSLCREHPSKVYNFINANDIGELCDSLHCCQSHSCAEKTVNVFEEDDSRNYEWDSDSFELDYLEQFTLYIDILDEHSYSNSQCPEDSVSPEIKDILHETLLDFINSPAEQEANQALENLLEKKKIA